MKPGIKDFHRFLVGDFSKRLREAYEEHQIVSEADLQAFAWSMVRDFLLAFEDGFRFKVLNKPYCKDVRIHPDIGVFKRNRAWVLLELKERRRLSEHSARKDWARLVAAKRRLRPRRAYLVYVARYGNPSALRGPKGEGARYFYEIPIVLEEYWNAARIEKWERHFKEWSKFTVAEPHRRRGTRR